jgi:hypothetical protein
MAVKFDSDSPTNKPPYYFHLLFSITFIVTTTANGVYNIFVPGRFLNGNIFWFTCPACFVPFTIPLVIFYWEEISSKRTKSLPLRINAINIAIALILFSIDRTYPDIAFHLNFQSYSDAVMSIQKDEMKLNEYIKLPEKYENLSKNDIVRIEVENSITSIYFADGADNFDGLSWGYLYQSAGSKPTEESGCVIWRNIQPAKENWYYCDVSNKWGGFIR